MDALRTTAGAYASRTLALLRVNDLITIVLVEDHALTRTGLKTALESSGGIRVVGEAGDGISGETVVVRERPAIAIVDIGLPGRDGVALTRVLKTEAPQTRIVILTMNEDDAGVLAALSAGAAAYCVKSSDPSTVIDAVRIVAGGGAYFDSRIAHVVLRVFGGPSPLPTADSPLTPRELDVLRLIAEGIGNHEIGERLNIALGTVKGHIHDILEKLSAADRTQAAVNALRRGLL
jgi:two-component system, NarL family, response regulator LiaR